MIIDFHTDLNVKRPSGSLKMSRSISLWIVLIGLAIPGCGGDAHNPNSVIRVEGSDTMVNIAQAWAENFQKSHPQIIPQVLGGGSGVGIASLIQNNCDLANSSRAMKDKELIQAKENHGGVAPIEHIVGYDALAVFVQKDNPLDAISLEELAEIYGDGGKIVNWSQLGVKLSGRRDEIVCVGRQNGSGTYSFFREAVLGKKRDYKLGSVDQSGSKDVVALIARAPLSLGYSGMGYKTNEVKALKLSKKKGGEGIEPTVANVQNGSYPLSRPLLIYTVGELPTHVKDYLEWIKSPAGQKIVLEMGYVPLF